jgi:hypothetical protein
MKCVEAALYFKIPTELRTLIDPYSLYVGSSRSGYAWLLVILIIHHHYLRFEAAGGWGRGGLTER